MKEGGSEAATGQKFYLGRMGECCPDWRGNSLATDACEKILLKSILAKKTRKNEGSHTQSSSLSKTFSPRLLKKELSPIGEIRIGVQEKTTL